MSVPITKATKGGYQWNGKGKIFATRRELLSGGGVKPAK